MANADDRENDKFVIDAADLIRLKQRPALAEKVEALVGTHDERALAYGQILPFMEDFQKSYNGEKLSPNEILGDIIKGLKADRLRYPIAALLAWMSYHHPKEAREFYQISGLFDKQGTSYRPYLGVPGDRAKIRKGLKPSAPATESAQFDASAVSFVPIFELPKWVEQIDEALRVQQRSLTKNFAGRGDCLSDIEAFVSSRQTGEFDGYLLLTSLAGMGKSALLAQWASDRSRDRGDHIVFAPFGRASGRSIPAADALRYLNFKIGSALGYDPVDEMNATQLMGALSRDRNADGGLLIVVVDGLDDVGDEIEYFLPRRFGKGVCLIISARLEYVTNPQSVAPLLGRAHHRGLGHKILHFEGLDRVHAHAYARKMASDLLCKHIMSDEELDHLYESAGSGHPFALTCLIRGLATDMNAQDRDAMLQRAFLGNFIKKDKLVSDLLTDIEGQLTEVWKQYFYVLCALRAPVPQSLISRAVGGELAAEASDIPASLRRWLLITCSEGEMESEISIGCGVMREIFASALRENLKVTHLAIADAFKDSGKASYPYFVLSYPFHLAMAGEVERFEAAIGDPQLMKIRSELLGSKAASDLFFQDTMCAVTIATVMGIRAPDAQRIIASLIDGSST
ncbi:ATP-binding protein [Sphingomonas sp. IBVSS2]|uniref:ATP-binding protein n=1 Tax=Sphingomonas sp. IBVSS2 TaxID=1985172 RepID=UPI00118199EA|nr:ATP-binding protein [Sphingomonas sp. IBVSS2]